MSVITNDMKELNVDSYALNSVGTQIQAVSEDVRTIYQSMQDIIEQVTSNDSWKGAASDSFFEKFNNIKPTFEQHLQQLEELGPTLMGVANNYSEAEENNIAEVKGGEL